MSRIASVLCFSALFLCLLRGSGAVSAEEGGRGNLAGELLTIEGEILEVDELKEPAGSAIYLVKNFATGETLKLFADAYRTVISAREKLKPVSEVLGGTKGTFLYRASDEQQMPVIVFAKVSDSSVS